MILETVTCLILHCHRCNVAFCEDRYDDYSGTAHWKNREDIDKAFAEGMGEYGGWRRFGDRKNARYICGNCQVSTGYADDLDARERPDPLPAAQADKVARAQAGYRLSLESLIEGASGDQ